MKFYEITENKKQNMDLLLLADEQEDMIDRYIQDGRVYVLDDNGVKSQAVVVRLNDDQLEVKNLATVPEFQGRGYGRKLLSYIAQLYEGSGKELLVGTGDSPLTVPFYEKCGFRRSHILENFFIDNYDHPIFEDGVQLVHMVYLKKTL